MSIKDLLNYEEGAEKQFLNGRLGYTEVPGNPELRKVISELYATMKQKNIIVHAGAQEPIFNFMNVLLNNENHVISQFPIYQSLFEVANAIGCKVSKWTIEQSENDTSGPHSAFPVDFCRVWFILHGNGTQRVKHTSALIGGTLLQLLPGRVRSERVICNRYRSI